MILFPRKSQEFILVLRINSQTTVFVYNKRTVHIRLVGWNFRANPASSMGIGRRWWRLKTSWLTGIRISWPRFPWDLTRDGQDLSYTPGGTSWIQEIQERRSLSGEQSPRAYLSKLLSPNSSAIFRTGEGFRQISAPQWYLSYSQDSKEYLTILLNFHSIEFRRKMNFDTWKWNAHSINCLIFSIFQGMFNDIT